MKQSKRGAKGQPQSRTPRRRAEPEEEPVMEPMEDPSAAPPGGPELTGGDVDADWARAESSGEEAVGGSVATPDQDVVDELGRALGVEQGPEAEVVTSDEILRRRDRLRWHMERDADVRERQEEAATEERVVEGQGEETGP
jgi:hypothetical protein